MKILTINAPAKVNLGLEVLHKRLDGYHNINSVFTRVPLFDKLTISESKDINVECDVDLGIEIEENLVYLAIIKFFDAVGIEEGVSIKIKKNIPSGSGLGGGSSDAAYTLLGLCNLFEQHVAPGLLFEMAADLGSDVPFFLKEGSAIVTGRGERLEHFNFTLPYWVQIVYPNKHFSTAKAYYDLNREYEIKEATDYKKYIKFLSAYPDMYRQIFRNDFEYPQMEHFEEIIYIKKIMYASGAFFALMTGTGSAIYALYHNPEDMKKTENFFKKFQVFAGKF
jgi:4-diphosphocytidyl-2-C-methyl-D-erythritol kinase